MVICPNLITGFENLIQKSLDGSIIKERIFFPPLSLFLENFSFHTRTRRPSTALFFLMQVCYRTLLRKEAIDPAACRCDPVNFSERSYTLTGYF